MNKIITENKNIGEQFIYCGKSEKQAYFFFRQQRKLYLSACMNINIYWFQEDNLRAKCIIRVSEKKSAELLINYKE